MSWKRYYFWNQSYALDFLFTLPETTCDLINNRLSATTRTGEGVCSGMLIPGDSGRLLPGALPEPAFLWKLKGLPTLQRGQASLGVRASGPCLVPWEPPSWPTRGRRVSTRPCNKTWLAWRNRRAKKNTILLPSLSDERLFSYKSVHAQCAQNASEHCMQLANEKSLTIDNTQEQQMSFKQITL